MVLDGVHLRWRSEVSLGHACAGLGPMHSLWGCIVGSPCGVHFMEVMVSLSEGVGDVATAGGGDVSCED